MAQTNTQDTGVQELQHSPYSHIPTVMRMAEERKRMYADKSIAFNNPDPNAVFFDGAMTSEDTGGEPILFLESMVEDLEAAGGIVTDRSPKTERKTLDEIRMHFPGSLCRVGFYMGAESSEKGDLKVSCEARPKWDYKLSRLFSQGAVPKIQEVLRQYNTQRRKD